MQNPTRSDRAYTMAEAAIVLGVSRSTLHRQIQAGQIPHIRIGRNIRISQSQLDRYLETDRAKLQAGLEQHRTPQILHREERITVQITSAKGQHAGEKALTNDQAMSLVNWLLVAPDVKSFTVSKG